MFYQRWEQVCIMNVLVVIIIQKGVMQMKFGYARGSKDDHKLELQIAELNNYGVDEIYEEKITEKRQKEHQLTELLGKLRAGDTLVVCRLSNLGLTTKQLFPVIEDFVVKGINFVSIQEDYDTKTVIYSLAQMERDVISERTKLGMTAAKQKGRSGGRKPKESKNIERALKMYFSNDFSIKDIMEATGLSKTTIYKYVREHNKKDNQERSNKNGKSG